MQGKNGVARVVDEASVTHAAAQYIDATLGAQFSIYALHATKGVWWVQIQCQPTVTARPVVVGSLNVDAQSGEVMALTPTEVSDIQARIHLLAAHRRQELARDEHGIILPTQAKVKATGYAAEQIAFFAAAEGEPQWVDGTPPRWRVEIALHLRGRGIVCDLGSIDVNALTGEVLPLSAQELLLRQKRAHDAAETTTRSAATTG
jgi:hypothetical protein